MGLSSAVLLDALIVRSVLVPAVMMLLGERNWLLPSWLERLLPRLNVEGKSSREAAAEAEARAQTMPPGGQLPEPAAG